MLCASVPHKRHAEFIMRIQVAYEAQSLKLAYQLASIGHGIRVVWAGNIDSKT